ncbi:unnamed protein product [Dicrocoelium dendriticum]|nr:unnamed protein product [Dicrocoelium dendriticum]
MNFTLLLNKIIQLRKIIHAFTLLSGLNIVLERTGIMKINVDSALRPSSTNHEQQRKLLNGIKWTTI